MATTSSAIDRAGGGEAIRPPGAVLARRYRLEARQRGAADRFAAIDRTNGERVFVKFGARGEHPAREAELLARLDHPGIARFKDAGLDGRPFMVLEWIDGSDLEAVLAARNGRLADDQLTEHIHQAHQASKGRYGAPESPRDLWRL